MSDSLIEQVQKCADLQKKWGTTSCFILDANTNARFNVDFPALLAHLEHTQAVVDAAREYRQVERDIRIGSAGMLNAKLAMHALDAALEKVNDHEQ